MADKKKSDDTRDVFEKALQDYGPAAGMLIGGAIGSRVGRKAFRKEWADQAKALEAQDKNWKSMTAAEKRRARNFEDTGNPEYERLGREAYESDNRLFAAGRKRIAGAGTGMLIGGVAGVEAGRKRRK